MYFSELIRNLINGKFNVFHVKISYVFQMNYQWKTCIFLEMAEMDLFLTPVETFRYMTWRTARPPTHSILVVLTR